MTTMWWLLAALAVAQDAPDAPTAPASTVRAVGFVGRPGGRCEPSRADRDPPCVDVVDFVDPSVLGRDLPPDAPVAVRAEIAAARAALPDVATLYARAFEDLANHWGQTDVASTLRADGDTALPPVVSTWGRVPRGDGRVAAGPSPAVVLGGNAWRVAVGPPDGARRDGVVYPRVRYRLAEDDPSRRAPPVVVLDGRFAVRLGASGTSIDFDVMNADPQSSSPFFEQLFPYRAPSTADVYREDERVPLRAFRTGRAPAPSCDGLVGVDALAAGCEASGFDARAAVSFGARHAPSEAAAKALAAAYFEQLHRVVFVQTAQYALDEYTTNHMRVLAAMAAMASPLLGDDSARKLSRDLVAAARGETDQASERLSGSAGGRGADRAGDRVVRLDALPSSYVRPWLDRLMRDAAPTRDMRTRVAEAVVARWPEPARGPIAPGRLGPLVDDDGTVRTLDAVVAEWATRAPRDTDRDGALAAVEQELLRVYLQDRAGRHLVQLGVLPIEVVRPWVARLQGEGTPSGYAAALDAAVEDALAGSLRPEPLGETCAGPEVPVAVTDNGSLAAWFDCMLLPGESRSRAEAAILRSALWLLLAPRDASERARLESWLLVDHARYEIARSFDEEGVASPAEVVASATDQWASTLDRHGYAPRPFPQGLGAVDPLSICTTRDGLDALEEPVFRLIDVDVLVAAPRGLTGEAVVEAASPRMPWQYLDDPTRAPEVEHLLDLGDLTEDGARRALYRVRWRVWSGWHMAWATAPAVGADGTLDPSRRELLARTTALCDDTVLADPDLVPTLVRAALLHANQRPTVPQKQAEPPPPDPDAGPSNDEVADALAGAPDQAKGAVEKGMEVRQTLLEPPPPEDLAGQELAFGEQSFEVQQEPLDDTTRYVRALAWNPLLTEHGDGGMLLFVYDASAPDVHKPISNVVPRTPYRRLQHRIAGRHLGDGPADGVFDDGRTVRTAAWMWYAHPQAERPIQLSPGYTPRSSVLTGESVPRWGQRRTVDFGLGLDAQALPLLVVRTRCNDAVVTGPNFAGDCEDGELTSQGFGFGLQGLATLWVHDHPRLGVDLGVGADLAVRPAGRPLYTLDGVGSPSDLTFGWAVRFQAGLLAGLRFAPAPAPRQGASSRAPVWGTTRNSGGARIGRVEWGLRGGVMIGPGFNGLEATVLGELWSGFSVGRTKGRAATFRPYHPGVLIGPFARFVYGLPAGGDPARALNLDHSWTAVIGLRTQLRLQKAAAVPKEAP